jgi:rubrerythrin
MKTIFNTKGSFMMEMETAGREGQVKAFNKLMKENKKSDLAMIALNEERVANMWRDTAQMNDERIHQLNEEILRLQEDLDKLHAAQDFKDIVQTEIVENLKKEKAEVIVDRGNLRIQLNQLKKENKNLKIETEAIRETLAGHRDSYIKVFDQLEKYHTGVLLHTDGTVNGTTFMIDGKTPHKMSSARVKANIKMGVQASYEVMDTDKAERVWIFGEKSDVNLAYEKRRQTHKEYREDRVRAMILEAAAHNNRTAPKLPKKLPELNKWDCPSCWAPNYTSETIFKKDRMKCGVCYQWTKAVEVKS